MSRTDDQRVLDILDAADLIAGVVKDGRKAWDQDRLRQLAVERLLEIIGESANTGIAPITARTQLPAPGQNQPT